MAKKPIALTIAGSDPSAGAGIQADLKVFHSHAVYGTSVITLLTAQNTTGVKEVEFIKPSLLRSQLEHLLADLPPAAIKTGALGGEENVYIVLSLLEKLQCPIVVDPILRSTSGAPLIDSSLTRESKERLYRLATLVTPNIPEAEDFLSSKIKSIEDMKDAALEIHNQCATNVLLKGGHLEDPESTTDILYSRGEILELSSPRLQARHGTGCVLSAAITANLALERSISESVQAAKSFILKAFSSPNTYGQGISPLDIGHI